MYICLVNDFTTPLCSNENLSHGLTDLSCQSVCFFINVVAAVFADLRNELSECSVVTVLLIGSMAKTTKVTNLS